MRRALKFLLAVMVVCSIVGMLPAAAQVARGGTGTGGWARAYCDGSADWIDALSGRVGEIPGTGEAPPEPAVIKAALVHFFKTAVRSTKRFETRLREAGHPEVPHGADIVDALTDGLADARRAFARARADAAELTTTDTAQVQAGADAAQATLQEELTKVGTRVDDTLRRFASTALGNLLRGEAACQTFLPPTTTTTTVA